MYKKSIFLLPIFQLWIIIPLCEFLGVYSHMPRNVLELLDTIEDLRHHLNQFAGRNNLTDPEVVSMSQRLDGLLNEYNAYIK